MDSQGRRPVRAQSVEERRKCRICSMGFPLTKKIYSSHDWDKLMLQYVVPKLATTLRDDFSLNPRDQVMQPLEEWVMPWHELLRASVFSHIFEVELWPRCLDTLHLWLVHPGYKPDEVANWWVSALSRYVLC